MFGSHIISASIFTVKLMGYDCHLVVKYICAPSAKSSLFFMSRRADLEKTTAIKKNKKKNKEFSLTKHIKCICT